MIRPHTPVFLPAGPNRPAGRNAARRPCARDVANRSTSGLRSSVGAGWASGRSARATKPMRIVPAVSAPPCARSSPRRSRWRPKKRPTGRDPGAHASSNTVTAGGGDGGIRPNTLPQLKKSILFIGLDTLRKMVLGEAYETFLGEVRSSRMHVREHARTELDLSCHAVRGSVAGITIAARRVRSVSRGRGFSLV
jgi:hypothetical protein